MRRVNKKFGPSGRVRRSHPNIFSDVYSDIFGDSYELGDDVADEFVGGGPKDAPSVS